MTDHTEEILATLFPVKVCGNNCSPEPQPRAAFNRNAYNRDGLQTYCRVCQKGKKTLTAQRNKAKKKKKHLEEHECANCHRIFLRESPFITRCNECKMKRHYSEQEWGGLQGGILYGKV